MDSRFVSPPRRRANHRRRSSSESGADLKTKIRAIKLGLCLGIVAVLMLVKLIFPDAVARLGKSLDYSVDFKAAFSVLGEGISGEKTFSEALGEAFTYAFRGYTDGDTRSAGAYNNPVEAPDPAGDGESGGEAPAGIPVGAFGWPYMHPETYNLWT